MTRYNIANRRLVGVFLLGVVLLNYPLLALFNRPVSVGGVPLLYGYIFGVWMALIVCVLLIAGSGKRTNHH